MVVLDCCAERVLEDFGENVFEMDGDRSAQSVIVSMPVTHKDNKM